MNSWVIPIVILFCHFTGHAQTHFSPIPTTGLPYTIIITDATLNDQTVVNGTEFAVFDDTLCVGVVVYQDTFPVQITAWQASPAYGLAGFTPGNSMLFKMYTQNPTNEWVETVASTDIATGDGNFGYGAYSALALMTTMVKVEKVQVYPENFNINAYPNPFNNQVNFKIAGLTDGEFIFKVYSITGREVFSTFSWNTGQNNHILAWHGQTTEGRELPSGPYLYALQSGDFQYFGWVTFQK
ncbi:MAG: T9SS type A sorting domain-containing protein [Candidatus Marinimicrobia bacterium]|nr:T9SS type A sorting domain-containing protein [Candidatus Neomarinimicrobiota bacterium]